MGRSRRSLPTGTVTFLFSDVEGVHAARPGAQHGVRREGDSEETLMLFDQLAIASMKSGASLITTAL
jgi:hypothetical protein